MEPDGVGKLTAIIINRCSDSAGWDAILRIMQIPIPFDLQSLARDAQIMAGRQGVYPIKKGRLLLRIGQNPGEHITIDLFAVRLERKPIRSDQGFDLRSKAKLVVLGHIIERLDAKTVTRQEERLLSLIP